MAGIYLHIPFCKTRCIYCDFYSTTRSELKTRYVHALCRELEIRKEYLKGEPVETIYFGGGTPSQLEEADFMRFQAKASLRAAVLAAPEPAVRASPFWG